MDQDRQAIGALIATWLEATRTGDVDTVLSLMAPDVVFLIAGQPPMRGREQFEKGLRAMLAQHQSIDSSSEVLEIEVAGDMAYCMTQLSVTVRSGDGGAAKLRAGQTLSVFRKNSDGLWRLTRDANLLAPV